jgi:hypothetical protein
MDTDGFERNEHGHIIVTIVGRNLTGAQEIRRLTRGKYDVSEFARELFRSTSEDSYNAKHRLIAGQVYKIALVPWHELAIYPKLSTTELVWAGTNRYGYDWPRAGTMARIREIVSDEEMKKMGFQSITAHSFIKRDKKYHDDRTCVLYMRCDGFIRWFGACFRNCDTCSTDYNDDDGIAFPILTKETF